MKKTILTSVLSIFVTTVFVANTEAHENDAMAVKESKIKAQEVIQIAKKARSGSVSKIVVEKENGKIIWDVEIVTKSNKVYNLEIDGKSKKVLENILDKNDQNDDHDD